MAALFLLTWGLSFYAMYISGECRVHIDPTTLFYTGLGVFAFGVLVMFTAIGLAIYWVSSSNKDELIEKDIKGIKTEIRGVRRELQKLPTAIAAILKRSPEIENAKATAEQRRTKLQTPKPKARNK
jgi:hypothetical protein